MHVDMEEKMDVLQLRAYGKINLGLDVLGTRPDGYHEVRMIMQTVGVYDEIRMEKQRKPGIQIATNLSFQPCNEQNLAYRAADLLMQECNVPEGVSIRIRKVIPVAAGMAGGSSDAAAVLIGVNRMFGLGFSKKDLARRAVTLGADVPYCIMRGTALAEGIGERLTPLPKMPPCIVVVAKPPVSVSTKEVYTKFDACPAPAHPDIDAMIQGLKRGDLLTVAQNLGNVLENVTEEDYPVVARIKQIMIEHGALGALMSGSGPTVFGLFNDENAAERTRRGLIRARLVRQLFVTKPVP